MSEVSGGSADAHRAAGAVFGTERLLVRPWHADEADRIFDMYRRDEVVRFLGTTPTTMTERAQAVAAIERWGGRAQEGRPFGIWACAPRDGGEAVGTVGLVPLPGPGDDVEVLWHLHPDSVGRGYASEAARGALAHAFAGGLDVVHAVVKPENTRSLAVCRRLGMVPLGRTTRWYDTEVEAFAARRYRWQSPP